MDLIFHSILAVLIFPSSIFSILGKPENQIKVTFLVPTAPGVPDQTRKVKLGLVRK